MALTRLRPQRALLEVLLIIITTIFNICVLVVVSYFGTAEGNRKPFDRRNFDAGRVRRAKTNFT